MSGRELKRKSSKIKSQELGGQLGNTFVPSPVLLDPSRELVIRLERCDSIVSTLEENLDRNRSRKAMELGSQGPVGEEPLQPSEACNGHVSAEEGGDLGRGPGEPEVFVPSAERIKASQVTGKEKASTSDNRIPYTILQKMRGNAKMLFDPSHLAGKMKWFCTVMWDNQALQDLQSHRQLDSKLYTTIGIGKLLVDRVRNDGESWPTLHHINWKRPFVLLDVISPSFDFCGTHRYIRVREKTTSDVTREPAEWELVCFPPCIPIGMEICRRYPSVMTTILIWNAKQIVYPQVRNGVRGEMLLDPITFNDKALSVLIFHHEVLNKLRGLEMTGKSIEGELRHLQNVENGCRYGFSADWDVIPTHLAFHAWFDKIQVEKDTCMGEIMVSDSSDSESEPEQEDKVELVDISHEKTVEGEERWDSQVLDDIQENGVGLVDDYRHPEMGVQDEDQHVGNQVDDIQENGNQVTEVSEKQEETQHQEIRVDVIQEDGNQVRNRSEKQQEAQHQEIHVDIIQEIGNQITEVNEKHEEDVHEGSTTRKKPFERSKDCETMIKGSASSNKELYLKFNSSRDPGAVFEKETSLPKENLDRDHGNATVPQSDNPQLPPHPEDLTECQREPEAFEAEAGLLSRQNIEIQDDGCQTPKEGQTYSDANFFNTIELENSTSSSDVSFKSCEEGDDNSILDFQQGSQVIWGQVTDQEGKHITVQLMLKDVHQDNQQPGPSTRPTLDTFQESSNEYNFDDMLNDL